MPIGRQIPPGGVAPALAGAGATIPPQAATGRSALPQSWGPVTLTGAETGGYATLQLPAAPIGYMNVVDRIAISTTSTQQTQCYVYDGPASEGLVVDQSPTANLDFTSYTPSGLVLLGGRNLTLVFSSMSAGAQATARIQYAMVVAAQLPALAGTLP